MRTSDFDVENSLNCLDPQQLAELLDFVLPIRAFSETDKGAIDSKKSAEKTAKH